MAYARRDIRGGAVQTTITAGISSGATSCAIAASTGWPDGVAGAFYVVIDPGLTTEEKILCSTRSTLTVNFTTRGADGSTASAHASGATIYPIMAAVDIDEANYAVSQTVGKIAAAGDLLVGASANTLAKLAKGSNSTVLQVDSGGTQQYGTVTSAMIADATITNTDISASAAIALSKLATDPLARANHTGTQLSTTISDFTEAAQDAVGAALTDGTTIDFTYSDGGNTITAEVIDGTITAAKLAAAVAGAGLTGGAGTALAVGAGTGITVSADAVAIDTSLITLGALTSFTPTWSGVSGSPTYGNGAVVAHYQRNGRWIEGFIRIALGSTSDMSTTGLKVLLPVVAADPGNMMVRIGNCVFDNNGDLYDGAAVIDFQNDTGNDRMRLLASSSLAPARLSPVATSTPFAWSPASTDRMTVIFAYEAAS